MTLLFITIGSFALTGIAIRFISRAFHRTHLPSRIR